MLPVRLCACAPALALAALVLLAGCPKRPQVRKTPPPPPPPPAFVLPPGCDAKVTGTFVHEGRRDWEYLASDDGEVLGLTVRRAPADGQAADAGPLIVLRRGADGFLGQARARIFAGGTACEVAFPTRVVACEEVALVLETVGELAVDEQTCEVAPVPQEAVWQTHRLVRLPPDEHAPAEDAPDEPAPSE